MRVLRFLGIYYNTQLYTETSGRAFSYILAARGYYYYYFYIKIILEEVLTTPLLGAAALIEPRRCRMQ